MNETGQNAELDALTMRLALAYFIPLGWALDDGEDVDPDDLAECLKSIQPLADLVREAVTEALDSLDELCVNEDRHGDIIRACEVRGAVAALRALVNRPGVGGGE